jgi:hypothetical protein
MIWQLLQFSLSGLFGTLTGCAVTWMLVTQTERNRAWRDALVLAMRALQDYRVAYANFYVEYVSPLAQQPAGNWAKPTTGKPDAVYLKLMTVVDRLRGRLRVASGVLYAHFPQEVIKPICVEITRVLIESAHDHKMDCRLVDQIVDGACDLIPDLLRKYS